MEWSLPMDAQLLFLSLKGNWTTNLTYFQRNVKKLTTTTQSWSMVLLRDKVKIHKYQFMHMKSLMIHSDNGQELEDTISFNNTWNLFNISKMTLTWISQTTNILKTILLFAKMHKPLSHPSTEISSKNHER
jgi:hypothetical protein